MVPVPFFGTMVLDQYRYYGTMVPSKTLKIPSKAPFFGRKKAKSGDREKVMRGLKIADTPVLKGYQHYHNYFREHEGLNGKTPAETAGIKIEGQKKRMTVIQNASKNQL